MKVTVTFPCSASIILREGGGQDGIKRFRVHGVNNHGIFTIYHMFIIRNQKADMISHAGIICNISSFINPTG